MMINGAREIYERYIGKPLTKNQQKLFDDLKAIFGDKKKSRKRKL